MSKYQEFLDTFEKEKKPGRPVGDSKGNTVMYRGVQKYLDGDLDGAKVDLTEAKRLGVTGNTNLAYAIDTIEREGEAIARLEAERNADPPPRPANYLDGFIGEDEGLPETYKSIPNADPDHSAKIINIAKKTGQSEDFVEENLPEAETASKAKPSEYWAQVERDYPGTTKWLYEGNNMAVAHDDVDNLGMRERLVADVGESMELLLDPGKRILAADRAFRGAIKKVPAGFTSGTMQVRQSELGWSQAIHALTTNEHDPTFDLELENIEKKLSEYQEKAPKINLFYHAAAQVPNLLMVGRYSAKRAMQGGMVFGLGAVALGQIPPLTGLPEEFVTVPAATALGMTTGGRIGAFEAMAVLEGGTAYREFAAMKDKNGNQVSPRLAAEMALAVGIANAWLEYASLTAFLRTIPGGDRILGHFSAKGGLFKGLTLPSAIRAAAKRYLVSVGTETITEPMQEAVAIAVGEVGKAVSGQPFEPMPWEERWQRIGGVISPAIQASMVFGIPGTAVHIAGEISKFQQTDIGREGYRRLGEIASESKLAERCPEAFADHLNSLTVGTKLQDVYIPADAFNEYCKKNKLDPKELSAKLGIDTLYQEAMESKGDIKIQSGEWAVQSKRVGDEIGHNLYQELEEDVKTDPESYTPRQQTELSQGYLEQFEKTAEEIIKKDPAQKEAKQQIYNQIYDQSLQELTAAGRPKEKAAEEAAIFASMVFTLSVREKITPAEARVSLISRIHGAKDIEAPGVRVTPDITETNIDTARKKLYSSTKAEISAETAYLASEYLRQKMGPGYRKIAINFMGEDKISQNNRFLFESAADTYGLGDAESLLKLISELPTREEAIKDMVETKLSSTFGDPRLYQYASEQLTKAKEMFDEDKTADEIQNNTGWVNEEGQWRYSPVMNVFGPDALYQMAPPTESEAFKKWFGDSKVIDDEGKPLVVYHGTSEKGLKGNRFDKTMLGLVTKSKSAKAGFYFVTDFDAAGGYSRLANEKPVADLIKKSEDAERTKKWDLAHKLIAQAEKLEQEYTPKENVIEAHLSIKNPFVFDAEENRFLDIQDEIHEAIKQARENKNDGIVFKNLVDNADWGSSRAADHWVAFEPTQIKSIYNPGRFDPANPDIMYQKALAPAFFSKLERALEEKMPNVAPVGQIKGILAGAGVRQEEIDWLGIDEFLKGKTKVSKQEMLDFVRANNVQIEEVEKGASGFNRKEEERKLLEDYAPDSVDFADGDYWYDDIKNTRKDILEEIKSTAKKTGKIVDAYGDKVAAVEVTYKNKKLKLEKDDMDDDKILEFFGLDDDDVVFELIPKDIKEFGVSEAFKNSDFSEQLDRLEEDFKMIDETEETTKFSQWQLPGGENYHELLLTLPEKTMEIPEYKWVLKDKTGKIWAKDNSDTMTDERLTPKQLNRLYDIPVDAEARWVEGEGTIKGSRKGENFYSSHYDEPNILAHIRFNDRKDAEGKRVLFVEEIQSDWHQAGRTEGYAPTTDFKKQVENIDKRLREIEKENNIKPHNLNALVELSLENEEYNRLSLEGQAINTKIIKSEGKIPDAPFKKTWHELALKRMLRYAAENGYDKLAWTTGEQQADRYDLSKQVESVNAIKGKAGISLTVSDKEGKNVIDSKLYQPNELPGVIGKELADKINTQTKKEQTYSGLDLKVGGQGMAGFYDKMLPAFLNKFVKKWGGRVGETIIDTPGYEAGDKQNVHALEITPAMKEAALSEGFPMFQAAAGAFDPRTKDVVLSFTKANASTFIHEAAHAWLSLVDEMVKDGRASESLIEDHTKLMVELGAEYDKPLTKAQQEKFAASFEAYLREGKAPTAALRPAFARFKRWLTLIYCSIRDIGAGILGEKGVSEEVRGIMDRMLATEDEISSAEQIMDPASKMEFAWLDPKVQAKLDKLRQQAHDEATDKLLKQQMTEIAEDRQAFLVSERQRITDEITETLKKDKLHLAITGMADTEKEAKELAGQFLAGELEEGSNEWAGFDIGAELLDFYSGQELAKKIIAKPAFEQEVSEAVDARMNKAYTDLKDTEAIRTEAINAVHGDRQLEVLALEREMLKSKVEDAQGKAEAYRYTMTKIWMEAEIAKARALEVVLKLKIGEIKSPEKYFTAERIAAVRVAKAIARKDYGKAAAHKHTQMLNHALGMAVIKAGKQVEKALGQIKKISSLKPDNLVDQETYIQVQQLLYRFGFMNNSGKFERTETLTQYLKRSMQAFQGDEKDESTPIDIPDWVADEATNILAKNLTPGQLFDVLNTLKNVIHTAKMMGKFYALAEKGRVGELSGRLADEARKNVKRRKKGRAVEGKRERAKAVSENYMFGLEQIDTGINRLDGFEDFGMWYKSLVSPIKDAADMESSRRWELIRQLDEIWGVYTPSEINNISTKKIVIPEFGLDNANPFYKHQLFAMALNLGNRVSRDKVIDNEPVNLNPGFDWKADRANTERIVMSVLEQNFDERDWNFVNNIWKLIGSLKEEAFALHKRVTGFEAQSVEALPFEVTLPDGRKKTMDGGYYPLDEDPRHSEQAAERELLNQPLYKESNPGFKAMTKTGHMKPRSGAQYAVSLKLSLISRHLNDVIHDIYFREIIIDLRRLAAHSDFIAGIKDTIGDEGYRYINKWIKSVATGRNAEKYATDAINTTVRKITRHSATSIIMMRTAVLMQNFANPFLAANRVEGFGHGDTLKAILGRGMFNYWLKCSLPGPGWKAAAKMRDDIYLRSSYMRDRRENPAYTLKQYSGIASKLGMKGKIKEFFIGLLAGTDDMTNIPVWLQASDKRFKKTGNQKEADDYADLLISRVTPSARKYDVAQILRSGQDTVKLFTVFYSFWNVEYNNWVRELGKQGRKPIKNAPRFMGFVASRMMFVFVSAILANHRPEPEWDFKKKVAWWAKEYAIYPISFFPFFRDIAGIVMDNALGLPSYGYRPFILGSAVEDTGRAFNQLRKRVLGEESNQRLIESLTDIASVALPYPAQLNAWFFNAYDYITNGMEPTFEDLYKRRPVRKR